MEGYTEINNINCITINTDASFHPKYKVSGYCFYIKSNHWTVSSSSQFKVRQPKTAEEAEMMAIGNAISYLYQKENLPKVTFIVINNDCKFAMRKIKNSEGELGKRINKFLNKLKSKLKITDVRFKYVKAHSGVNDKRSWVNEFCDKNAKEQMRIALNNKMKRDIEKEFEIEIIDEF